MKMNKLLILLAAAIFVVTVVSCNNTSTNEEHDEHMEEGHDEMMEDHMEEDMPHDETDQENHQMQSSNPDAVKSPRKSAMANIGDTHIHVDYAAPSMRGRQIFGGLVGYGHVWTPGAHKATTIEFYEDVVVEGQPVPKGKYGLFTIPGQDQWTVIINKNNDMHLADDYSESEDVVRFKLTPEKLQEPVEQLIFEVKPEEGNQGQVVLKWAEVSISFSVTAK